MGLKGSKSQTSFFSAVEFSSIILPQKRIRPLSGALWYNLSLSLAAIWASVTDCLFVLSLMLTAFPCYSTNSLVTYETFFLGGMTTVMTLPLTLAVSSLLKSLFILKISIDWSSFSSLSIWRNYYKVEQLIKSWVGLNKFKKGYSFIIWTNENY